MPKPLTPSQVAAKNRRSQPPPASTPPGSPDPAQWDDAADLAWDDDSTADWS